LSLLKIDTIDTVYAIEEEDKYEDKGDLTELDVSFMKIRHVIVLTFKPYCILAMNLFSERKTKSLRRHVNGIGTTRAPNTTISATKRANT
jgi:hypothetical protein